MAYGNEQDPHQMNLRTGQVETKGRVQSGVRQTQRKQLRESLGAVKCLPISLGPRDLDGDTIGVSLGNGRPGVIRGTLPVSLEW